MNIEDRVKAILKELPQGVILEGAAKGRTPKEIEQAINAGIKVIGENYVKEAKEAIAIIGSKARWHFIGHLQRNKVKVAVSLFDMIETLDSLELAREIDKYSGRLNKIMPVLVEVNSASEPQKSGLIPQKVEEFLYKIGEFQNLKILGLMTMGPFLPDPQDLRPYFRDTANLFKYLANKKLPSNVEMRYLSMGMSATYKVAIEEGANIIRIGTLIFGPRS